ncbi:MAG: 6-phosphogluconolactonase [Hyphomicrobiaceae bacterium]
MHSPFKAKRELLADAEALSRRVADWILDIAIATTDDVAICLSGGSTPRRLYECLAESRYRDAFPWARMHWFWGDERFVPRDDAMSNYRMARDALLSHAPIPPDHIHPIPTEDMSPDAAASAYERELQFFYRETSLDPARPLFDVMLLGLGPDGHVASLFPNTAALTERDHWVAAVVGAKAEARITLTYPVINSSRHAAFLVVGKEKQKILSRFCLGDESLPATYVRPIGKLWIFADMAAAEAAGNL